MASTTAGVLECISGMVDGNSEVGYLVLSPAKLSALDLLRYEDYYVDYYTSVKKLIFSDVQIYNNCVVVKCTFTYGGVTFTIDDVTYQVLGNDTNNVSVIAYSGNATSLTIPENVAYNNVTYTVTEIGEGAFENNENLTSISLPNTITYIDEGAFNNCSNLASMTTHD